MMNYLSTTPTCQMITATKDVVDELLALNTGNRHVRASHVKWLAAQIENGDYTITNQGIGIDVNGRLIDGQHRLLAIAKAGYQPVPLLVVSGLPVAACAAVDIGINRTLADLMHFAFDRTEATSSMIACVRFWGMKNHLKGVRRKPTPHEMAMWYAELSPVLADVMPAFGGERAPASVIAAVCDAVVQNENSRRPIEFISKVFSGVGLEADSPELCLARYLATAKGAGGELQNERYRKTEWAIRQYMEGRKVSRLGGFVRSKSSKRFEPESVAA